MRRVEGWEAALAVVMNERRQKPYVYGSTDCWCLARAAVQAMTGETMLPDVEPPKGWLAAAKIMIAHGWESVEDLMTETLGPPIEPNASRPGDIVSFVLVGEIHLAVRIGDVALTPGRDGLVPIVASAWRNAWRTG